MTPSATARRLVEPAFSHVPAHVETYGPEVAELGALAGVPPDPEQELGLDALFAIRSDGKCAAFEFCVICCRQNLKTHLFKLAALGWLYITDQRLIVWSAHEFSTTKEAFEDLVTLVESTPVLSKRLAPGPSNGIYRGTQDMSIRLKTRQRIKFKARTNSGGRGLSGDRVILDEGMFLKPAHMGSLLPTLSARPDPQVVVGSSAGLMESMVLRGMRDRGRAGMSARQAYLEWAAPEGSCLDGECRHALGTPGCALDNRDFWRMGNPAMGRRISEETIAAEREALSAIPEEFARERLGWWDDPAASGPFPPGVWQQRAETAQDLESGVMRSQITGPVSVALDVAWDRRGCGLAVSGRRDDGRLQVELIVDADATALGTLPRRAAEVVRNHGAPGVLLDPASAAGSLIPALQAEGVDIIEVSGRQVGAACGFLYDAAIDGTLVHLGQLELDTAIGGTTKRESGESWRWDRKGGANIAPTYAVTFAAWGAAGAPEQGFNIW